jgi:hypothetical protein
MPFPFEKGKTIVQQFSDLSMKSRSTIRNYAMIRIMSPESLSVAREVFGRTFGIGTRNLPPRKGAPRKVLEVGNKINLVNTSVLLNQQVFCEHIASERIDLVYEELTRTLSIRIKYSSVLAEDPRVSEVLHFVQPLQQPEPDPPRIRPLRRPRGIAVGTSFVHNGKLFTVTASDGIIVNAVCAVDGEVLNMPNNEVWQIIMNSIS